MCQLGRKHSFKSRQVKCERCTSTSNSGTSAHISSTKEVTDAIELRNELYELKMGPSDILEVYLSYCQKTIRSSMTMDDLTEDTYRHVLFNELTSLYVTYVCSVSSHPHT